MAIGQALLEMGQALLENQVLLQAGAPCIIFIDDVNSPCSWWWGEVLSTENKGTRLAVKAKITGGRVCFDQNRRRPIRSDEQRGVVPTVNYTVYPDTETVRGLVAWLISVEQEKVDECRRAQNWQKMFLDTMAYLLRAVAFSPEVLAKVDQIMKGQEVG